MKIALATELDIRRRDAWSGTILFMHDALVAAGAQVQDIGPVGQTPTILLGKIGRVFRALFGADPMLNRWRFLSRLKAREVERRLAGNQADIVFAPVGSTLISEVGPGPFIAYASDATLDLMAGYYRRYRILSRGSQRRARASEAAALRRADLLIYPTQWSARSAIEGYGVDPARILVQPFGANLADPPKREEVLGPRREGPLRLLFCAVEWERKGGDIVVAALERLLQDGVEAELTILGCTPPAGAIPPALQERAVHVIPFLSKAVPEERARFRRIFAEADMLVLPTRAEAYGLVFCEAAAFGTISIATATGGIPEVIRDGETGLTLPPGADGAAYAGAIQAILADPERLETMRRAARDDFETRLNWQTWAAAVLARMAAAAELRT